MNGTFDIYTLLLLVVAVVILLRLRRVLGRKTGNERRYDPLPRESGGTAVAKDKVVPLPTRETVRPTPPAGDQEVEDRIRGFMPDTNPAHAGLLDIARQDSSFDPAHFVRGAKSAYEMIVTAFAEGNRKVLKDLLSKEVYDGFCEAIADREGRSEMVDQSFVGINKVSIVEAEVKGSEAQLTARFNSQLISATRDRGGNVIAGDPQRVKDVTDFILLERQREAQQREAGEMARHNEAMRLEIAQRGQELQKVNDRCLDAILNHHLNPHHANNREQVQALEHNVTIFPQSSTR